MINLGFCSFHCLLVYWLFFYLFYGFLLSLWYFSLYFFNVIAALTICFLFVIFFSYHQGDYRKGVEEIDQKEFFNLRLTCIELRNTYVSSKSFERASVDIMFNMHYTLTHTIERSFSTSSVLNVFLQLM